MTRQQLGTALGLRVLAILVGGGLCVSAPAGAGSARAPEGDDAMGGGASAALVVRGPGEPLPTGVTIPSGPFDAGALQRAAEVLGRSPDYVSWYVGFSEAPDLAKLRAVAATGAVPMITWEPYVWTEGVDQPRFALDRIADGDFDAYAAGWATALAAWGGPVLLRFAHEMNGDWYPWCTQVNGNDTADYVAAWTRLHGVFAAHGADNVAWVWAPNVVTATSTPLAGLYPGGGLVDVIGVDGYNAGTAARDRVWASPSDVFGATLDEIAALAPGVPVLVTETGSSEVGGDKADWVGELYGYLGARPQVVGVVWFDVAKDVDWRIASSPGAAQALRRSLVTG